jgi:hypothetical protein
MEKGINAESVDTKKKTRVPILSVAKVDKYYDIEFNEDDLTEKGREIFAFDGRDIFRDKKVCVASLEKWFKFYEDAAAPIIRKMIIDKSLNKISDLNKCNIAVFIILLLVRGPHSKKLFEKKVLDCDMLEDKTLNGCFKKPLEEKYIKKIKWEQAFLSSIRSLANWLIYNMNWSLVYPICNSERLITTDNPVVLYLPKVFYESNPLIKSIGVKTPMAQMFLPLSPNCLLQIVDSQYDQNIECFPNSYGIQNERISLLNNLQRKQALQWIFSE